jgi:pectin methylesterase-like acyl-CoA thioesterase
VKQTKPLACRKIAKQIPSTSSLQQIATLARNEFSAFFSVWTDAIKYSTICQQQVKSISVKGTLKRSLIKLKTQIF